ncbi:MAG: COX15/CtaA family protein [Verrucomicrobia bacterium]|nr:COX15/CtaA family protein [Verrucomicrobiota bacterium]
MSQFALTKQFLHWYSLVVAAGVLLLICSGGLVTSHGAGMAVPDWPNSFGYNMFLFPISRWVGGVFFEHTHRLIASGVGLLTIALFILTLIVENRVWVKWLAGIAVLAVIFQGVLGGLRVTEHNAVLGLFHGCLAQGFFCLVSTIALVTSRFWRQIQPAANRGEIYTLRFWTFVVTAMLFVQLVSGASMRHSHTGLAIPDFPTVYGGFFPPLDPASIAKINAARAVTQAGPPITPGLIMLQYAHRGWAVLIVVGLVSVATAILRNRQISGPARSAAGAWLALVFGQFILGAWTIWSNKAADIATAHVFVGALIFMTGVLLSVVLSAMISPARQEEVLSTLPKEAAKA